MNADDFFARHWEMLIGRWGGPLWFRFLFQPLMAVILAVRAALKDARAGRDPCVLWPAVISRTRLRTLLALAWKDLRQVFIFAILLDVTYELVVYRWVYPLQAIIVATALTIIPYLLIRGPVTRLVRRWINRSAHS
jgi:hypothetical protein